MASSNFTFDNSFIEDEYFEEALFIGVFSALQPYRLAWLLNNEFELELSTDYDLAISQKKNNVMYSYPVYEHLYSNKFHRILLYKLIIDNVSLLPELKKTDYLLIIQTANLEKDYDHFLDKLKEFQEITLVTPIKRETLKNLKNLII